MNHRNWQANLGVLFIFDSHATGHGLLFPP